MNKDFYKAYEGFKNCSPEEVKAKLKAGNGMRITEALFIETIQPSSRVNFKPIYSLQESDNQGCPSAYQIYLHSIDETDAALKLVGSLNHWKKLCKLRWFLEGRKDIGFEGIRQWRLDKAALELLELKHKLQKKASQGNLTAIRALQKMMEQELKQNQGKGTEGRKDSVAEDGLEFLDDYR